MAKKRDTRRTTGKLPIQPMERKGEVIQVPVDRLVSGIKPLALIEDAMVAYLDVMGFASKKKNEDMEATVADFIAPLEVVS